MVAASTAPTKNVFDEKSLLHTFFKEHEIAGQTRLVEARPEKLVFLFEDEDEFQSTIPLIFKRCEELHMFVEVVARHIPEVNPVRDAQ